MNDDTISRQAAIEKTEMLYRDASDDVSYMLIGYNHALSDMRAILKSLPSAERRGRWDNGFCSVCGEEALTEWNDTGGEYAFTTFCPNCGAKMDSSAVKGE